MLHGGRAKPAENVVVRTNRVGEAGFGVLVEAVGDARQRHAVDVLFGLVERHPVFRTSPSPAKRSPPHWRAVESSSGASDQWRQRKLR